MKGRYVSLYLRKKTPLDLPDNYEDVVLEMTCDDGYVAYLNGHEIGRSANMERAGSPPKFNYVVPNNHEIDEGVDAIDLRRWSSILNPPPALNTLAIQGHNGSRNSTDFSIRPRPKLQAGKYPSHASVRHVDLPLSPRPARHGGEGAF